MSARLLIRLAVLPVILAAAACATRVAHEPVDPTHAAPRLQPLIVVPPFKPLVIVPGPPPPSPNEGGTPLDLMSGRAVRIEDALLALFADSSLNYMIEDGIDGTLSIDLKDTTYERALGSLLDNLELAHHYEQGVVVIGRTEQRTFDLTALADAAGAGKPNAQLWQQLTTDIRGVVSITGRVHVSPVSRTVEIEAPPATVAAVESYLDTVLRWVSRSAHREDDLREIYDYGLLGGDALFPERRTRPAIQHDAMSRHGLSEATYARAVEAVLVGEHHRALKLLREALMLDPELADAHVFAAIVELQAHDLDRAQAHLDQAQPSFPDDPVTQSLRGIIELRRELPGAAIDHFDRVHLATPNPVSASNLAAALMAAGRYDGARDVLVALDSKAIDHPHPHLNLAYLHLLAGELGDAEHEMDLAARLGVTPGDLRMISLRALAARLREEGSLDLPRLEVTDDPSDDVPGTFLKGWH